MRASPASHLSQSHAQSHATAHAAQTSHNNKADETSSFAQLMDTVAPQEKNQDKKVSRSDARAEKPADDKKPAAQDAQTEAKEPAQDNKQVAGDKPETNTEETVATDTAEDTVQTAAAETGDAAPATPAPQPAPQSAAQPGPSLLAALTGDTAQAPDMAAQTQITAPDAAPALGEAQLAAATAQGAADAKPLAATDAKTAPAGKTETQPADSKPQAEIATAAANDNAAPEAAQSETAPAISTETAAKPAPQTASTNMAVQAPVQPQTAAANANSTPALAAQVQQHVEVSDTPKPNLTSLAVEISAKSQSGAKQFDIRLDPPELGRVEVRLSIDATGKASAHLSADQPQTLELLQKDASILTRALRDAGLDMSQSSLNFSLRQQAQGQQGGEQRGHARGARSHLTATQSIEASTASATTRANGGVDIRV